MISEMNDDVVCEKKGSFLSSPNLVNTFSSPEALTTLMFPLSPPAPKLDYLEWMQISQYRLRAQVTASIH